MKTDLAKHLWQSPDVRRALRREAWRLVVVVVIWVGATAMMRYLREKPLVEGLWSAAVGVVVVATMWLVSAVQTLRAVLREHGLLRR